jgi:hypothetical protein
VSNCPDLSIFFCFTGEMLVDVEGGKKRADAIREGDLLWSRDEFDPNGPLMLKAVEERFVRVSPVLNLRVAGQLLRTTGEHPFWAANRGRWLPARELKVGDQLRTRCGSLVAVEAVEDSGEVETVYNWRIADYHTYYVSAVEDGVSVWAHNAACIESKSYASSEQGRRLRQSAMMFRSRYSNAGYRNIATADVTLNGRSRTVKFINTPGGLHSEEKFVAWYDAMNSRGNSVTLNAIYTDRIPCPPCNSLLTNIFGSDLTVFHAQGSGIFLP